MKANTSKGYNNNNNIEVKFSSTGLKLTMAKMELRGLLL
jgi:hypothetical protein